MAEIGILIDAFRSKANNLRSGFQSGTSKIGTPSDFETTYPGAQRTVEILGRMERGIELYHEALNRDVDAII